MIPRLIHQIWLGGSPPPSVQSAMASVRRHHPHWEVTIWTDRNLPRLENSALFAAASSAAMKADVLRYELLHTHGGVYLDADFVCHRPVDQLFPPDAELRLVSEFGVVCNSVMACSPGHPFMRRLIDELARLDPSCDTSSPHLVTGPYFVDEQYVEEGLAMTAPDSLLPGDFFFPPRTRVISALELAAKKQYVTHLGLASWRKRSVRTVVRQTKLRTRLRRFVDLTAE